MNIYALSSGRGPSGIAIIRISGKQAIKISERITQKTNLTSKEVNFCKFYNPSNNSLIDEGLLLLFKAPNSFTGDDLVEFHIHGSNARQIQCGGLWDLSSGSVRQSGSAAHRHVRSS